MGMRPLQRAREVRDNEPARPGVKRRPILPVTLKGMVVAVLLFLGALFLANLLGSAPAQGPGANPVSRETEPSPSLVPHALALLQAASIQQGFPRLVWERELQGKSFLRRGDGYLFACTQQGEVLALDPRGGAVLWEVSLGGWISSPPLFRDGNLYTGNANRRLYALDGRSGRVLWFFPTQGEIISSPVTGGGMVFFFADNDSVFHLVNRLYVVDGKTGALRWSYETPNWSKSPPAVGDALVYAAGYERRLVALSLENGTEAWSYQADNIIDTSPALLGDTLVASTVDGEVLGLDALRGQVKWKASLPGPAWTAHDASRRLFLYYDRTGTLSAFLPDGRVAWSFRREGLLFPLVREEEGEIMVFDDGGRVHLLDSASGARTAILHLPFTDPVSAEADDGLLFVASGSGKLACFDLAQVEWLFPR
jgi:outer membrane protein assembly factor BamB